MKFRCKVVSGFRLLYEENLWDTMPELEGTVTSDLEIAASLLPKKAKEMLQSNTKIYIYVSTKPTPEALSVMSRYHPQHCNHQHFAGNIVISAAHYENNKLLWSDGAILVHEFAHAFHDKYCVGGFENEDISKAYNIAVAAGLYDNVPFRHCEGQPHAGRAYACTNAREFFAELSVAYLYVQDQVTEFNRTFPFNRYQLQLHDPASLLVVEHMWQVFEKEA